MEFLTTPRGKDAGCVFCTLLAESDDRKNLIIHRDKNVFVILNKYPYNNGHLMIVPNRHVKDVEVMRDDEMSELFVMSRRVIQTLKDVYKAEGFNMGMNLGEAGGAGIKEHLHLHVVPRWNGDTNFMPVLADTKSMPQHLEASFDLLHSSFRRL